MCWEKWPCRSSSDVSLGFSLLFISAQSQRDSLVADSLSHTHRQWLLTVLSYRERRDGQLLRTVYPFIWLWANTNSLRLISSVQEWQQAACTFTNCVFTSQHSAWSSPLRINLWKSYQFNSKLTMMLFLCTWTGSVPIFSLGLDFVCT